MKLIKLQEILGKEIQELSSKKNADKQEIERANAISRMAKQIILNANSIDRICGYGNKKDLI